MATQNMINTGNSSLMVDKDDSDTMPTTAREEMLSEQVQRLQEQIQSMRMLNQTPGMSHAISQPSIHNGLFYNEIYIIILFNSCRNDV